MSADSDSVASRTCADMDRETVVVFFCLFGSVSNGKRDRDQNVVQTLRDRKNLHKILERKLNWPCEEKNWLSKDSLKLKQTRRSNIGKREILILLFTRSIRSYSPNDYSYNGRIHGLTRLKVTKLACVENWK